MPSHKNFNKLHTLWVYNKIPVTTDHCLNNSFRVVYPLSLLAPYAKMSPNEGHGPAEGFEGMSSNDIAHVLWSSMYLLFTYIMLVQYYSIVIFADCSV